VTIFAIRRKTSYEEGVEAMASLTEEAFARYAFAWTEYANSLLAEHLRDGAGCCKACGRPSPCPERRRGGELLVHFGQWRSETWSPADGSHPAAGAHPGCIDGEGSEEAKRRL
jgi:hypothetical protein